MRATDRSRSRLAGGVSNCGTIALDGGAVGCGSTDTFFAPLDRARNAAVLVGSRHIQYRVDVSDQAGTGTITALSSTGIGKQRRQLDLHFELRHRRRRTLKVIKHVVNDNGGTAVAADWNLAVSSSNGGSGTGSAAGVESPGTSYTLQAGKQYSVAESGGPSGIHRV